MDGDRLGILTLTPGVEPPVAAAAVEAVGAAVGAGGGVDCVTPSAATDFQSSPSSATTAMISPTLTVTFSSVTILAMVPSSVDSMAMTALSVWISHTTSPSDIVSPGSLCHFKMVPSSMVGDNDGIFSWTARRHLAVCRFLAWDPAKTLTLLLRPCRIMALL